MNSVRGSPCARIWLPIRRFHAASPSVPSRRPCNPKSAPRKTLKKTISTSDGRKRATTRSAGVSAVTSISVCSRVRTAMPSLPLHSRSRPDHVLFLLLSNGRGAGRHARGTSGSAVSYLRLCLGLHWEGSGLAGGTRQKRDSRSEGGAGDDEGGTQAAQ